jgi:putative DNA primase/helicase
LARLAGSWVNDGLSFEECLENAHIWNSKNTPPLEPKEVERTVKSIYEKHFKRGRKTTGSSEEEFNPLVEAERFISGRHFIFLYEQIREYKDGYYQVINDRILLEQIARQLNNGRDNSRLAKSKEILETIKNILCVKTAGLDLNTNPEIINCKNGLLDVKTMKLLPHTHEMIYLYQINANYDPEAKCPSFMKFLEETIVGKNFKTDNELIKIIQQFIGYCFYTAIPFHKALILYGQGSNGKSKLISVICKLLEGFVSCVNFEIIGDDKFATSDLAGKLLNVSSEISMYAKLKDGDIKSIIAGDPIRGQRKHERAFEFRPFAKHIISTNNLPATADRSFGFFRRFEIIPFRQTFLTEKEIEELTKIDSEEKNNFKVMDPFLEEKLIKELDGIFLWAVQGLKELLEKSSFSFSEQVEEMKGVFKIRSKSVETFTEIYFSESASDDILLQEAYRKYILYCQQYAIPPLSNRKFSNTLKNLGYIVERGSKNQVFIKGVELN